MQTTHLRTEKEKEKFPLPIRYLIFICVERKSKIREKTYNNKIKIATIQYFVYNFRITILAQPYPPARTVESDYLSLCAL